MQQEEFVSVLKDWRARVEPFQEKMGEKATKLQKLHYTVGIPSVVLGTIASTSIFAQAGMEGPPAIPGAVTGTISMIAAVLAGVITFVSHARRAEQHRGVAAQLTGVRRTLDIYISFPPESTAEMRSKLEELNKLITEITDKAPTIQFRGKDEDDGASSSGSGGSIMPNVDNRL